MTAGKAGDLSRYSDHATGWTVRGSISGRAENYSVLRNVQIGFGAHQTSDSLCPGASLVWIKCPGNVDDHSSPSTARLRICGAIRLIPPCAFVALTGTAFFLILYTRNSRFDF